MNRRYTVTRIGELEMPIGFVLTIVAAVLTVLWLPLNALWDNVVTDVIGGIVIVVAVVAVAMILVEVV